jgi:formamidopyrimidine-DNA glycosylase
MPELPDVESFRRYLERTSLRREIRRVRVLDPGSLRDVSRQRLSRELKGRGFVSTRRHGKHLFTGLPGPRWLVMHFGMTGRLEYGDGDEPLPDHSRVAYEFAGGSRLAFVDMRKLGFVTLTGDVDRYIGAEDLGPDALALSYAELRDLLRSSRGALKSTLMDQSVLAGVGNVYSDEILFHARLDPRQPASRLDDAGCRQLHRQLRRVLRMAADRDADPDQVPQTWLLPNREDGVPCPRGHGEIRKVRLAGRGAFWCPACQSGD